MAFKLKDNYTAVIGRVTYAYKKVIAGGRVAIVKLMIPANALIRTGRPYSSALNLAKCRSNMAYVVSVKRLDGTRVPRGYSFHQPGFAYVPGHLVTPRDKFNTSSSDCSSGIHWFLTEGKAKRYSY